MWKKLAGGDDTRVSRQSRRNCRSHSSLGGTAFACRCDHTNDEETKGLIERIRREQGRLDILVNNVWGLHELESNPHPKPFWEYPLQMWDATFQRGSARSWRRTILPSRLCSRPAPA
ncbi:SDR family NAD(P)-dependent oxidoreductase [Paenibacillus sp. CC-CFT747]|nr:SDR family NAD(P)-dependent oxidoreductase [Paenibacillus sp. CC-CFT747]